MSHQIYTLENAQYMKAAESYSLLFFTNKKVEIKTRPMKFFSEKLYQLGWCKIHKSFMVNPLFVEKITDDRDQICLISGEVLPISRRNQKEVLRWRRNLV